MATKVSKTIQESGLLSHLPEALPGNEDSKGGNPENCTQQVEFKGLWLVGELMELFHKVGMTVGRKRV